MGRALAIINPAAGRHAALDIWNRVHASSEARAWDCALSERPGHARDLAAAAVGVYSRVIAVGGDGTVCEVANALAGTDIELAIIPAGTGNDVAVNLGVPKRPTDAAHLAMTGASTRIDLGQIETAESTSYFVNVAGFGFDADVAWRVNHMPKLIGGTLPYVAGVLQTLWRYRSPSMRITLDDRTIEQRVFLVAVGNCASYGGGMQIVPDAKPDDGMFDVCMVKDLSRLEVLRIVPRLYSGSHVGHPAVELFRCRALTADADRRVLCQADGELVGGLPARFALVAGALRCVRGPVARTARS